MQSLYVLRICDYPSHKYETNQNAYINQFKSIDYPTYIYIYIYKNITIVKVLVE